MLYIATRKLVWSGQVSISWHSTEYSVLYIVVYAVPHSTVQDLVRSLQMLITDRPLAKPD
jgi:hypothetical protein